MLKWKPTVDQITLRLPKLRIRGFCCMCAPMNKRGRVAWTMEHFILRSVRMKESIIYIVTVLNSSLSLSMYNNIM